MNERYDYQTYTITGENNRLLLVTDVHLCHIDWYGTNACDRLSLMCKHLNDHYGKQPYDAILSLGDYSLDFWKWNEGGSYLWNPPVSNTETFVKTFVPQLPVDFYMIPGNHEQYGEENWRRIVGRAREYAVAYGKYVFVMLATFSGNLDPTENHDGCYTGINTAFLSAVLRDHPDKKIILCAHDIIPSQESDEARALIASETRILCAFTGHTHRNNTVLLSDGWRNLPVFYCGDFSYCAGGLKEKNWGYRILELSDDRISAEYFNV